MASRSKIVKASGVNPDELELKIAQELSNIEVSQQKINKQINLILLY